MLINYFTVLTTTKLVQYAAAVFMTRLTGSLHFSSLDFATSRKGSSRSSFPSSFCPIITSSQGATHGQTDSTCLYPLLKLKH